MAATARRACWPATQQTAEQTTAAPTTALRPPPATTAGTLTVPATPAPSATAPTDTIGGAVVAAESEYGVGGWSMSEDPAPLVAARATADGVALRGYLQVIPDEFRGTPWPGFPGWTAPAHCNIIGNLRITSSLRDAVGISETAWLEAAFDGASITPFVGGGIEGQPYEGVAVPVDDSVASARLQLADGRSDESAAMGGLILLAVPGAPSEAGTVVMSRADGSTFERSLATPTMSTPEYSKSCMPPPPALPAAGEQPADPAASEAAVRDVMAHRGRAVNGERVEAAIYTDDPTGVDAAIDTVLAGDYATQARSAQFDITELVFTSPAEAWFRYDLTAGSSFPDRYGTAVLVDGQWKLTRATVCQDLSLAGVQCAGAPIKPVLPPSAANDPRDAPFFGGTA